MKIAGNEALVMVVHEIEVRARYIRGVVVSRRAPRDWLEQPDYFGMLVEDTFVSWHQPTTRAEAVEYRAATSQHEYCFTVLTAVLSEQKPGVAHEIDTDRQHPLEAANLSDFSQHLDYLNYQGLFRVLRGYVWLTERHRIAISQGLTSLQGQDPSVEDLRWENLYKYWEGDLP